MAKLASLVVDLQVQSAQLKKGLDEANRKLDDFGRSTAKIGDAIKGVFSFALVKAGVDRLAGFLREGTEALAEEEKSAGRLSAAFNALGYDAAKVAPYFNDLAEALEDETLIGGETIRQVEQLLVQFGVAPRDIEKTTRAILDYSAATGKDAVGAAQQLVTSVMAGKDEIRKMGISIQATGDFTRDLDAATSQLADHFGGSAKGATENLAGQLGRLQKAQEDLGKALAHFFVESAAGKAVIQGLTDAMNAFTESLSKEARLQDAMASSTKQITKLREDLANAERRIATEKERIAQGSWLASKGSLLAAQQERNALQERLNHYTAVQIEANHALVAEHEREQASAKAADAEASAEAKRIANEERLKKAHEAAAAAAKKAAQEREAIYKRLTAEAERWAEAQARALADFTRVKADNAAAVGERQRAFDTAGATGPDTRGFGSFGAAMAEFQRALDEEAGLRLDAARAAANGEADRQAELERAADAQKRMAENADAAAGAFTELKKSSIEAARAMQEASKAALNAMISKAIGPVGGLIQAGAQGATAGAMFGPEGAAIGAAVGVGLELLTQSKQFKQLMDIVSNVIQTTADSWGKLLEPLLPFGALLEPLATAIGAITEILAGILRPAFELLWAVLKPVVMVVLKVTEVIGSFWNGLVGMLQSLFRSLGGISIFGAKPLGFLNDWANGLDKAKVNLQGIDDALAALDGATYDSVEAQQKQADASKDLTAATGKATAALTNVPSGYKVALARFEAANADALRSAGGASTPAPPPAAGGGPAAGGSAGSGGAGAGAGGGGGGGFGGGGGGGNRSQNVVQVFIDGDEVLQRLRVRQEAQAQRQAGRRFGLTPRLVGAF